jgi:uncharacterized OsmC-like protein
MSDTHREVGLERIERGRYRVTNARGGEMVIGDGAGDDFTPVELLLAAIAGCTAIDVDLLTTKRTEPEHFSVTSAGEKVRDDDGNRMEGLQVRFDVAFDDDEAGRAATERLPDAIRRSHDRLCTVSRTVELGTPVDTQ